MKTSPREEHNHHNPLQTASYYNAISPGYDALYHAEQTEKVDLLKEMVTHFGLLYPNDTILDVGCGTAISSRGWGRRVVGVDVALELLQKAGDGIFVNAEAEHLPFRDKTFDVVISVTALQNFHDISRGLHEIRRVGRRLYILTYLKRSGKAKAIEGMLRQMFKVTHTVEQEKDMFFFCTT